MARADSLQKAKEIEEQIKKLQEKQKRYIEKAHKEIGKYLMDAWDIEDIDQAKKIIDLFKDEVKKIFNEESPEEEKNMK